MTQKKLFYNIFNPNFLLDFIHRYSFLYFMNIMKSWLGSKLWKLNMTFVIKL